MKFSYGYKFITACNLFRSILSERCSTPLHRVVWFIKKTEKKNFWKPGSARVYNFMFSGQFYSFIFFSFFLRTDWKLFGLCLNNSDSPRIRIAQFIVTNVRRGRFAMQSTSLREIIPNSFQIG